MARSTTGLFRTRGEHGHAPVTYIELFFDLVFVFAITQLSHGLLEHLGWTGALQTLILLFAVWWVWIYTTWAANWLDPERANVRLMRSEEHTSELQSLMRISYAVFCLKKKHKT